MLLGAIAASRLRPETALPLPFPLGGFGAVYDPYHLASMVGASGGTPVVGDAVVGILPSHGSNHARTSGGLPNRLVLDATGIGSALPPLLALKDGRLCWDLRGSPGRALWGSVVGHDLRSTLKGCFGAMLWLEYGISGAPMALNRHATAAYPRGLLQPWEVFSGNRSTYPYGNLRLTTSGVVEAFFSGQGNDSSNFLPASGAGGGWHACIVQYELSGPTNPATTRFNAWKDGVELQDATGTARQIWDNNATADDMDRFTLGAQQHAGAVASGRFFQSWIGRSFWCEAFLDDAEIAAMTAWLQGTAHVAPAFAAPFTPVFRMGAQTGGDVAAPDGGLPWLTRTNATSASPVSAAVSLGGGGGHAQDSGGAASYSYDASVNRLRFPAGAMAEWEMWGDPVIVTLTGVPDGAARVNLVFRETSFTAAGSRVFDITINGALVENGLDIAGTYGADRVVCLSHDVTVAGGTITIVLDASTGHACLTGVEVLV